MPLAPLADPRPPLHVCVAPEAVVAVQDPLPLAGEPPVLRADEGLDDRERAAVLAVLRLLLEALAGARPLAALEPLTSTECMRTLARGARRRHVLRGRSVHVASPSRGAYELAVRAFDPQRGRDVALALRLERRGARLVCTDFDLGPGPSARFAWAA